MAGSGQVTGLAMGFMFVVYVAATLATNLNNANVTIVSNLIAAGAIAGMGIFSLIVILKFLGQAAPSIKKVLKSFS